MLIVSGVIEFDPEDHAAAEDLFRPLVAATLAEPGNGTYGFWADIDQPGRFRVYEEWSSPEALAEHMGTPHMLDFLTGIGSLRVVGGTGIFQHSVTDTTQLM
jgi:quinol monooxygenase YgiN